MYSHRPVRRVLAGAIALAVSGFASIAMAQTPPEPPMPPPPAAQPMPPPPPSQPMTPQPPMPPPAPAQSQDQQQSGQFYPGTETTAQYPLPDSNGGTLTVRSGMSDQARHYGPPPSFSSLDTNHNGRISEQEAKAYPPLDSDFLFASGGGKTISKAQYQRWVKTQFQQQ